jgi:NADPH:quinone reductase-like Zn-dependent oxidoreductase
LRAITYTRYGPPEVLTLSEVDAPKPGDDEVLIRVHAAEATKSDCEMRSFRYSVKWFWLPMRIALGVRRPKRSILGSYFSGEIVAVGANVSRIATGDRVFGAARIRLGAYAEYLVLPRHYTIEAKPQNMTFAEAAAVPLGGLNALHFMRLADVRPGERVLINGAGGSIGAYGVQIARAMGGVVTAVDRAHKREAVCRFGAEHFIDYEREDFAAGAERYDVVFDMVPGGAYRRCIGVLKPGGRYLSGNPSVAVMLRSVLTTRFSDKTVRIAFARETNRELADLREMIEDGRIGSIVDRVLPMEDAAEAHRLVETEERCGAIVISMENASNGVD